MERDARPTIAVIGAGPAGLMAAEAAMGAARVELFDRMPSPARKLLMAGKSGLNLTKAEDPAAFADAYGAPRLAPMLAAFGPADAAAWAEGLGQPLFTGSTGRVFPTAMKASPLLRAWLARLEAGGVTLHARHRWTGWDGGGLTFDAPEGPVTRRPDATVLAMGGASWRRLGSDGAWADVLSDAIAPFAPSNVGLSVGWSAHMARHFGAPLKNAALLVEGRAHRGEVVVTAKGLEGGGLYPLTPALRRGASLRLDLAPDLTEDALADRLARAPRKASLANRLRRAGLSPVAIALAREWADGPLDAAVLKRLPVRHAGLRPLDEAISTAGGLRWDALDDALMLRDRPGTFAAGEMLDWEAPTGGYLLTACLATGLWAGRHAAAHATGRASPLSG